MLNTQASSKCTIFPIRKGLLIIPEVGGEHFIIYNACLPLLYVTYQTTTCNLKCIPKENTLQPHGQCLFLLCSTRTH